MAKSYHLIGSYTCPWVQRAVIAMRAKEVPFEVTYVDLRDKPDWLLEISPHGKVPVLKVDDEVLFESNAIAEYLDETVPPRLHPEDPIKRARNRAWTDFVPGFSSALGKVIYAKSKEEAEEGRAAASRALSLLEEALAKERGNDGPYFNGDTLSLVDAGYAPFLQRFGIAEAVLRTGLLDGFPLVRAWSDALMQNGYVINSTAPNFAQEYESNLQRRETYLWSLIEANRAAAQ
ncbi:MAG: glutathione S-transferase family protein [Alphaproteobacteria bacterium]|nr:glutathione S-transferase family protein [Alphaproteobacteria bacterium]